MRGRGNGSEWDVGGSAGVRSCRACLCFWGMEDGPCGQARVEAQRLSDGGLNQSWASGAGKKEIGIKREACLCGGEEGEGGRGREEERERGRLRLRCSPEVEMKWVDARSGRRGKKLGWARVPLGPSRSESRWMDRGQSRAEQSAKGAGMGLCARHGD